MSSADELLNGNGKKMAVKINTKVAPIPNGPDLFFTHHCVKSEMLIERYTYERYPSLFYTETGVVLFIMVWNCVADEPVDIH